MFFQTVKKRFFKWYSLVIIIVSIILLAVTFVLEAAPELQEYIALKMEKGSVFPGFPWGLSEQAANRQYFYELQAKRSQSLSFYVIMYYCFNVYMFVVHFIITMPYLQFYDERHNGYFRLIVSRGKLKSICVEALADSTIAALYVLIPCVIFWGIAVLVGRPLYPLSQDFNPSYDYFFQVEWESGNIIWLYLFLIILTAIGFFLRGFFVFICSIIIEKKVILLFISLFYSYVTRIAFVLFGLWEYASFSYIREDLTSLSPMLFSWFLNLVVTVVLSLLFFRKEKVING